MFGLRWKKIPLVELIAIMIVTELIMDTMFLSSLSKCRPTNHRIDPQRFNTNRALGDLLDNRLVDSLPGVRLTG